jgi:hypothetical protein
MPTFFSIGACSYLTLSPSFVTCGEWSQSDWRSILCMGGSCVSNGLAGQYWSYSMSCIQIEAFAAITTIILRLDVHIWYWGHHLSLVMNGVKVTDEAYPGVYQHCVKWYSWAILIILYVMYPEIGRCCNAHICLLLDVHIWPWSHHLSVVMNWVKVTEEAYVWVPAACPMV